MKPESIRHPSGPKQPVNHRVERAFTKSPEFGVLITPASVVLPRRKSISISKKINSSNY
jgi:hypothetical protein